MRRSCGSGENDLYISRPDGRLVFLTAELQNIRTLRDASGHIDHNLVAVDWQKENLLVARSDQAGLGYKFQVLAGDNDFFAGHDLFEVDAFDFRLGRVWFEDADNLNDREAKSKKDGKESDRADSAPS